MHRSVVGHRRHIRQRVGCRCARRGIKNHPVGGERYVIVGAHRIAGNVDDMRVVRVDRDRQVHCGLAAAVDLGHVKLGPGLSGVL